MNRQKGAVVAVAVVLVLAAAVVGVRVADPLAAGPGADSVDPADPPEEMAYAAMKRAESEDFALSYRRERRFVGPNGSEGEAVEYRARYDNSRARVLYETGDGLRFENPYFVWTADGDGDSVRRRENVDGIEGRFYREDRVLGCGCAEVRRENDTAVVLRIDDPALVARLRFGPEAAVEPVLDATLTLVVDATDWHLRRATARIVLESTTDDDTDRVVVRHVEQYRDWGDVTVERPSWAGYSPEEFVQDLLNVERRR